ncbi:MAG: mechanosensitive ion channel family protein [Treponema sp.]|jgi:MscS family membrane protein|nr:mechanosensitive ion channel family protein [Treponema sp.]
METIDEFLARLFLNNTVSQWLTSAAFILGGLAAGKLCSLAMRAILHHICRKTSTDIDDILVSVLEKPLGIAVALGVASLSLRGLHMRGEARLWTGRILQSLFIVIVAWGFTRILDSLIHRLAPARALSPPENGETDIRPLLHKFGGAVIWLIAGALILRVLGYDVSALLAGLGLGGAALALASKDTLSNFFGSITVFVDRPFRLNDRIKIGAYEGVITEMGVRTSKLRTLENRIVFIPNSLFAANPIENISAAPSVKAVQNFMLKGENGADKIEEALGILREICSTLPGLEGIPQAAILSTGGAGCQVSLTYFVSRQADYTATVNQVNLAILRRFAEAGISLG